MDSVVRGTSSIFTKIHHGYYVMKQDGITMSIWIKMLLATFKNTNNINDLEEVEELTDYYLKNNLGSDFFTDLSMGINLITLYEITRKEPYLHISEDLYRQLIKYIKNHEVTIQEMSSYMAFFMAYETKFNKLGCYMDIYKAFMRIEKDKKELSTNLYHECNTAMIYDTNNKMLNLNIIDLRLNYVYAMTLVDTLEQMDEQIFYEYKMMMDIFKALVQRLLEIQNTQLKNRQLDEEESAMMSYVLFKGIRLGYLPERYKQVGEIIMTIAQEHIDELLKWEKIEKRQWAVLAIFALAQLERLQEAVV